MHFVPICTCVYVILWYVCNTLANRERRIGWLQHVNTRTLNNNVLICNRRRVHFKVYEWFFFFGQSVNVEICRFKIHYREYKWWSTKSRFEQDNIFSESFGRASELWSAVNNGASENAYLIITIYTDVYLCIT